MKFYKYKQLQRCTFFGHDDLNLTDDRSVFKKSPQSAAGITDDTKIFRFNIIIIFKSNIFNNFNSI